MFDLSEPVSWLLGVIFDGVKKAFCWVLKFIADLMIELVELVLDLAVGVFGDSVGTWVNWGAVIDFYSAADYYFPVTEVLAMSVSYWTFKVSFLVFRLLFRLLPGN